MVLQFMTSSLQPCLTDADGRFRIGYVPAAGKSFLGLDPGIVRVFDATSGRCTFAPDGRRLVSTGSDGKVRIWPLPVGDLER